MRLWAWLICVACGAAVIAGFGGGVHPVGDSLAVFRMPLAVICGLAGLWALRVGAMRMAASALVPGLVAAIALADSYWQGTQAGRPSYTLYQKNLLYLGLDNAATAVHIQNSDADFVTLQEVGARTEAVVNILSETYPSSAACGAKKASRVVAMSRFPRTSAEPVCRRGFVAIQVQSPDGPVWVVSVHLPWPYPHPQVQFARPMEPLLENLNGLKVLGGDFNMVPWGNAPRRLARAGQVQQAGPARGTYDLLRALPLPIDQVFASGGGSVEAQPKLGSDHRGLLAQVWF